MQTISCPNCGSPQCKEITEEKWVCLVCDNVFLVHNLSKEFRQTDEHITDVHSDLKKEFHDVKNIISTSLNSIASNSNSSSGENPSISIIENAKAALIKGDVATAYTLFQDYTYRFPNSCIGYYGMFESLRIETEYYKGLDPEDGNFEAYDLILKALSCDDNDEEYLNSILAMYRNAVFTGVIEKKKEEIIELEKKYFISSRLNEWNEKYYRTYGECPIQYQEGESPYDEYNYMQNPFLYIMYSEGSAGLEKYKRFLTVLIQYNDKIIERETIVLKNKEEEGKNKGFFGSIVSAFSQGSTQSNIDLANREKEKFVEIYNKIEEFIKDEGTINSLDTEGLISDMKERLAKTEYVTSDQVFDAHEELKRRQEQKEEDEADGFYALKITNWGRNSKNVYEYIGGYMQDPKQAKEYYKNNAPFTITGYRKTLAYSLQETLIGMGATAYVNKM